MTDINDLVAGGYDPLQDFNPEHEHHARYVRFALRIEGRDDRGKFSYVEGTPGDRIGDLLWPYKDQPLPLDPFELASPMPRDRVIPAWAPVFPAIVTKSGEDDADQGSGNASHFPTSNGFAPFGVPSSSTGGPAEGPVNDPLYDGPVAPGGDDDEAGVTPILELDVADDRFDEIKVHGTGLTKGRKGLVVSGTHDGKQAPIFMGEAGPFLAVNAAGDPLNSTIIYDTDADGKADPKRFAFAHSSMRVVRPKDDHAPEKVPLATGAKSHLLAWQLGRGGKDGLAGFGLVSDFPRPGFNQSSTSASKMLKGSPLPGPRSMSISTGGISLRSNPQTGTSGGMLGFQNGLPPASGVTNPDAMPYADAVNALNDLRYKGYNAELKQVTQPDRTFVNAVENTNLYTVVVTGDGFDSFTKEKGKPKPAVKLAVGAMSVFANGPIDSGGPGCPHELGVGWDGTHFYSAHISTEALFRSQGFDGPLSFEGYLDRDPGPQPLRSRAHIVWNGSLSHDHVTGEKNGRWVVISETMLYVVKEKTGTQETEGLPGTGGGGGGGATMCDPPSKVADARAYCASPFSQMFTGIFLRATDYTPGARDTRYVGALTDEDMAQIDSAPVVGRLEAYGNRLGGAWNRANESGASAFPGGSSNGGFFFSPPEVDIKNTINDTTTDTTEETNTGFIFHPDTTVGYGVPDTTGAVTVPEPFVYTPTGTPAGAVPVATGTNGETPTWTVPPSTPSYGAGYDGVADFDGVTNHVAYSTRVGTVYTLTRHLLGTVVTVRAGVTVQTAGFGIFGQTSITTEAGSILDHSGGAGGSGATGGAAGAAAVGGEYLGGFAGGAGANGAAAGAGTLATNSAARAPGGAGGAGALHAAGAAGSFTNPPNDRAVSLLPFALAGAIFSAGTWTQITGGSGGGGGGSADATIGGGGGGGAGIMLLAAPKIIHAGTARTLGGNGGAAVLAGAASGGGAGGGGVIFLIYGTQTGAGTFSVSAGTPGLGATGKPAGASGVAGELIRIHA